MATKRDVSIPILERRKVLNYLIVNETMNDENSIVACPKTMDTHQFYKGDTILFKGKKWKDTICIAMVDYTCEDSKIKMSKVEGANL